MELDLLKLWNITVNPNLSEDFDKYLVSVDKFKNTVDAIISNFREPHRIVRQRYWESKKLSLQNEYNSITENHINITVPFDQHFTYIK